MASNKDRKGETLEFGSHLEERKVVKDTETSPELLVGSVIGDRYRLLRLIGTGGMGSVYESEHIMLQKRVAVKLLREEFIKRPRMMIRFKQEAKILAQIGHENIANVIDFGETSQGQMYIVMEYLQGEDLRTRIEREQALPITQAVPIIIQICKALKAAHKKGIIHRDMKPENVFLISKDEKQDFVKILDFGVAKILDIHNAQERLTSPGVVFGTPEYISPEQIQSLPLDHRVDIYSVGIIMYEMLTGKVPFRGDSFLQIVTQHLINPPPSPLSVNPHIHLPSKMEEIIFKALSKEPEERYQSMDELIEDLLLVSHEEMPIEEEKGISPIPLVIQKPSFFKKELSLIQTILIALPFLIIIGFILLSFKSISPPSFDLKKRDYSIITQMFLRTSNLSSSFHESKLVDIKVESFPKGASVNIQGRGKVGITPLVVKGFTRGQSVIITLKKQGERIKRRIIIGKDPNIIEVRFSSPKKRKEKKEIPFPSELKPVDFNKSP
jgi:serine/threonine protein kinase